MRSNRKFWDGRGVTIVELLIVISVFLIIIFTLAPFVNKVHSRSLRLKCADNLRAISLGIHKYAADHDGKFPAGLKELCPKYIGNERVLSCPAVKVSLKKDVADYKYITGLTESSAPHIVIVSDSETNHKKYGRNILKVNGLLEWESFKK